MCGDYNREYDGVLMNSFGSYFWNFSDSNLLCKVSMNPFHAYAQLLSFVYIVLYDDVCGDMKIFGITLEDCTGSHLVVV